MQAMLQAQQAKQPEGYCAALHEPPAAPRPTAEEQEALAAAQHEELLQRLTELEASKAGECGL
jgi:hypothetical protein